MNPLGFTLIQKANEPAKSANKEKMILYNQTR